jgi:SAM-dependent methyltransferase
MHNRKFNIIPQCKQTAACPVCGNAGIPQKILPSKYIYSELKRLFNLAVLPDLKIIDYVLFRCVFCSLEFAVPPLAGSKEFYDWITNNASYYSGSRWEYQTILDKISQKNESLLLDVGCGDGEFLSIVSASSSIRAIGIDITKASIKKCQEKGLETYCMTVEELISNNFSSNCPKAFNYIVAFHLLEHLPDPKYFVRNLKGLLVNDGKIFLSTPYSPLSYEGQFFMPLNNPPHHLTRWNKYAFSELAVQLGMKIDFYLPTADSLIKRTLQSLRLGLEGNKPFSYKNIVKIVLKNPNSSFREFFCQLKREKINGETAPEIILVKLENVKS